MPQLNVWNSNCIVVTCTYRSSLFDGRKTDTMSSDRTLRDSLSMMDDDSDRLPVVHEGKTGDTESTFSGGTCALYNVL